MLLLVRIPLKAAFVFVATGADADSVEENRVGDIDIDIVDSEEGFCPTDVCFVRVTPRAVPIATIIAMKNTKIKT